MTGVSGLILTVLKIGVGLATVVGFSAALAFYHGYSKGGSKAHGSQD